MANASINLADLNGSNGFTLNGVAGDPVNGDLSGNSVSGAGDINGDGIDDMIIGAPFADPNGNQVAGQSYVVFGSRSSSSSPTLHGSGRSKTACEVAEIICRRTTSPLCCSILCEGAAKNPIVGHRELSTWIQKSRISLRLLTS